MKKNKKVLLAAGGLACVALMAGTFAWLQSNDEKVNHFEGGVAGDSDVTIVETWKPPTTWLPGQEVVKEAGVLNTGQFNELVRVSFKESLQLLSDPEIQISPSLPTGDVQLIPAGDLSGYNAANGWSDVDFSSAITDGGYTLKGVETKKVGVDPNTGEDVTAYRYIFWWENAAGEQFVARFSKTGNGDETINENENDVIVRATDGKISFNNRDDINFAYVELNYQAAKLADWMTGTPSRPANADIPVPSGWVGSQIDLATAAGGNAKGKAQISIGFENIAASVGTAPTDPYAGAKEWVYNAADGYFYYLAVLQSGQSTPNIINKVKLDNDAGKEYTALKYDLTVRVEAIQPIEDAVKEVWGLTSGDLFTYYQGLTTNLEAQAKP